MIYFNHVGVVYRQKIKKIFLEVLKETDNEAENISVGVRFCGEEEIRQLNREHRGVDKITDVLSFPMLDIKEGQALREFDYERTPSGELYIGDIVVCCKRAHEQAKEYQHSYKRELMFLITHGFLHILGYDHMNKEEEARMMQTAEKVLNKFNLGRKNV